MQRKFGTFSSWEILSDTVAIKHCDLSVFKYNGTNVSLYTKWFWGIDDIAFDDSIQISLVYDDKEYYANICCYKNGLIQMYFSKEFGKIIKSNFVYDQENKVNMELLPSIRFSKINNRNFIVSFIRINAIGYDNQNELTNGLVEENNILYGKEGRKLKYYSTRYERDPKIRIAAIKYHGVQCAVCGFDFEKTYGEIGRDFIEEHHKKPLSSFMEEIEIDPQKDLVCLCSNCHSMIHRKQNKVLTVDELKEFYQQKQK